MILADTSVWIDFLRRGDAGFKELLCGGHIAMHDFVLGELACGNLRDRQTNLAWFAQLPRVPAATNEEVLYFIEEAKLYGRRLGWVDLHLLASARLNRVRVYTRDEPLSKAAADLAVVYDRASS